MQCTYSSELAFSPYPLNRYQYKLKDRKKKGEEDKTPCGRG